jgi:hypothetical protein
VSFFAKKKRDVIKNKLFPKGYTAGTGIKIVTELFSGVFVIVADQSGKNKRAYYYAYDQDKKR